MLNYRFRTYETDITLTVDTVNPRIEQAARNFMTAVDVIEREQSASDITVEPADNYFCGPRGDDGWPI